MLTMRKMLSLSTARPVMHISPAFCERIAANYDAKLGEITGEELLHLLSEPAQLWVQEGEQFKVNNIFQDNRKMNVMDTVNQILNRILLWNYAEFTYQDQVFVERQLRRLGIRQVSDFLGQMRETLEHCEDIVRLKGNYENRGSLIRETVESLRELHRPWIKENGEKWKIWEAGKDDAAGMLHRDIYRRLDTRKIYEEILQFNRCQVNHNLSGNRTDQVFRLAEYERPLLWLKMSEAEESVLGWKREIVPQMNPYELVFEGQKVQNISSSELRGRERIQEQMISAILINLAEQARVFELEHRMDAAMKRVWNHVENEKQKPVQDYGMVYVQTDGKRDTTEQRWDIKYEWTDFRYAFRETAINTLKRFERFHREGCLVTERKRETQREIYRLQAEEETFLALLYQLLEMEQTEAIEAESCGALVEKAGKLILDWKKEWGEDKKEDGNKRGEEDYKSRFESVVQKLKHYAGREKNEERTGVQKENARLERRYEAVTKYRTEQVRSSEEGQRQVRSQSQFGNQNQDQCESPLEGRNQGQSQNQFNSQHPSRSESQEQPYDLEQSPFPEEYIGDGNRDGHSAEAAERRLETEVIISNVNQEKSDPWQTIPLDFLENDTRPEAFIKTEIQKISELLNTDNRQKVTHRDDNIHSVKELLTRQIEVVAGQIKAMEVRRQQLLSLAAGRSLEDEPRPGSYGMLMKEGLAPKINQDRQTKGPVTAREEESSKSELAERPLQASIMSTINERSQSKAFVEYMQNEREGFLQADMELRPGQTGKNNGEILLDSHSSPEIKVQKEILAAARLAAKLLAGEKRPLPAAKREVNSTSIISHQARQIFREQSALFREHSAMVRERAAIARETTDSNLTRNSSNENSPDRSSPDRNSLAGNNWYYETASGEPTVLREEIPAETRLHPIDITLDEPITENRGISAAEDSQAGEKYKEMKAYLDEVNKQNVMKYREISEKQILPVLKETKRTPDMKKIREESKLALTDPVKMMEHLKKLPDTPANGIESSSTSLPASREEREKRQQLEVILRQADDTTRYIVEQIWNYRTDEESEQPSSKARPASQIQLVSDLNRIVEENQSKIALTSRENAEAVVKSMAAGIHGVSEHLVTRWNRSEEGLPVREENPVREVPIVYRQHTEQITEELLEKLSGKQAIHINQNGKPLTGTFSSGKSGPGVSGPDRSGSSIFSSMSASVISGESFGIPQTGGIRQTEVIKNRTAKEIQELIEKGLAKQMGMISEKVYQKLEKKLESEMARRGR